MSEGKRYIGVDPGPTHTGYCELSADGIGRHGWIPCAEMLAMLRSGFTDGALAIIESPQAQDRPLGPELRNTIFWAGRFLEALDNRGVPWREVEERSASLWLTGNGGTNVGVKMALKNHFGDGRMVDCNCQEGRVPGKRPGTTKQCPACNGEKQVRVPGPLRGFNEHELSALAAALYAQQSTGAR